MRLLSACLLAVLLAGCAGKIDYTPPASSRETNTKLIAKSRAEVWNALVPALAKNFFVVNTIDKSSGLINISYSGSPLSYVDCGQFHVSVTNARGTRNYDFAGASPHENYEKYVEGQFYSVTRNVSLDGRMNIVVEETGTNQSRITVNARYVVQFSLLYQNIGNGQQFTPQPLTLTFNTGSSAAEGAVTCQPNGRFERDILALVN